VRLLGVLQRRLGGYDERFTHLQQALFELLPPDGAEVGAAQLDEVLKRAAQVQKEAKAFERQPAAPPQPGGGGGGAAGGKKRRAEEQESTGEAGSSTQGAEAGPGRRAGGSGSGSGSRSGGGGNGRGGGGGSFSKADLERQIGRLGRDGGDRGEILPASAFAEERSGDAKECLRPASTLLKTAVGPELGGSHIFCDAGSVAALRDGGLPTAKQAALKEMRAVLRQSKAVVEAALPSLRAVLADVVHAGYDAANDGYLGFCTENTIIINLYPLLRRAPQATPRALKHELVMTLTHEVAHLLEKGGDHGPEWRGTHEALLQAVYEDVLSGMPGAFAHAQRCSCCNEE